VTNTTDIHTLEGQLAAFDRHQAEVRHLMVHLIENYWSHISSIARIRLYEGFPLYGHATWERSEDDLWQEALEEVADQLNYLIMLMERCQQPAL